LCHAIVGWVGHVREEKAAVRRVESSVGSHFDGASLREKYRCRREIKASCLEIFGEIQNLVNSTERRHRQSLSIATIWGIGPF